jgi:ABC-type nitrate/sulfonate/bicarbonate transport system substrate-binding protein
MTRQQLLTQDPDVLTRFLKATLHAVDFARANPEEATDIVMRYAPQEDRAHQLAMLKVELGMADGPATQGKGVGWSTREQWQALNDTLLQFGGIKSPAKVDDVFTNQVLESVYKDVRLNWP